MQQSQEFFKKFGISGVVQGIFFIVFYNIVPLCRLHKRDVVIAFDGCDFFNDGETFGQQLSHLGVDVLDERTMLAEQIVGISCWLLENERVKEFC